MIVENHNIISFYNKTNNEFISSLRLIPLQFYQSNENFEANYTLLSNKSLSSTNPLSNQVKLCYLEDQVDNY